jgi:hypothetical protein
MISGIKNDNSIFSRVKHYSSNMEQEYKTVIDQSEEGLIKSQNSDQSVILAKDIERALQFVFGKYCGGQEVKFEYSNGGKEVEWTFKSADTIDSIIIAVSEKDSIKCIVEKKFNIGINKYVVKLPATVVSELNLQIQPKLKQVEEVMAKYKTELVSKGIYFEYLSCKKDKSNVLILVNAIKITGNMLSTVYKTELGLKKHELGYTLAGELVLLAFIQMRLKDIQGSPKQLDVNGGALISIEKLEQFCEILSKFVNLNTRELRVAHQEELVKVIKEIEELRLELSKNPQEAKLLKLKTEAELVLYLLDRMKISASDLEKQYKIVNLEHSKFQIDFEQEYTNTSQEIEKVSRNFDEEIKKHKSILDKNAAKLESELLILPKAKHEELLASIELERKNKVDHLKLEQEKLLLEAKKNRDEEIKAIENKYNLAKKDINEKFESKIFEKNVDYNIKSKKEQEEFSEQEAKNKRKFNTEYEHLTKKSEKELELVVESYDKKAGGYYTRFKDFAVNYLKEFIGAKFIFPGKSKIS